MKILLINKFHFQKGGAERAVFDTGRILAEMGHEVIFFAMSHPENRPSPWSPYFPSRIEYLDEKLSWIQKFRLALRLVWNTEAAQKLDELLRATRPDIAHLHNIYHQLSPSILWTLKKHGVPMVMTLHDYKLVSPNYNLFVRGQLWTHASAWRCIKERCVKNSYSRSVVCALEKWLHDFLGSYRLVSLYIAPSQFLIDQMKKMKFPHAVLKIPQPLLPFPENPISQRGEYLLYFGRLSEEKGVETLLEALRSFPQLKTIIVGDGPQVAYLKQKKSEWNLISVEFVGPKYDHELGRCVREAKAVIIPSRWYENMPYTLLEALGAGKIVLASRIGGITERIRPGINGFLFEAGSAVELAQAIQSLLQKNSEEIAKMENAAYQSVRDLRPGTYGKTLENLYQSVLNQADKKRG